jgi:hypothetical protein
LKYHAVLVYENVLFAEGRALAFRSPLRTDGDFCHQGRCGTTDMTIHWKALEEKFLMV